MDGTWVPYYPHYYLGHLTPPVSLCCCIVVASSGHLWLQKDIPHDVGSQASSNFTLRDLILELLEGTDPCPSWSPLTCPSSPRSGQHFRESFLFNLRSLLISKAYELHSKLRPRSYMSSTWVCCISPSELQVATGRGSSYLLIVSPMSPAPIQCLSFLYPDRMRVHVYESVCVCLCEHVCVLVRAGSCRGQRSKLESSPILSIFIF